MCLINNYNRWQTQEPTNRTEQQAASATQDSNGWE